MKTILLILLTATSLCTAQEEFSFRNFTTADGLSQSYVYCITQDAHGFIWAGTRDGLNRFDGYTFKQYHHIEGDSTSLPHDVVSAFAKDSKGNVWIRTYNRISRIETETGIIHPLPLPEGVPAIQGENAIGNFCFDISDNIWYVSSTRNLYKYTITQNRWQRVYLNKTTTSSDTCSTITCTKNGTLYCIAAGRLYIQLGTTLNFKEMQFTYYSGQDTLQPFYTLYEGNNHTLWGYNGSGVYSIDVPQQRATLVVPLVGWKGSIKQTPDNTIWIVSESGIQYVNPNNPKQLYTIPCNEYNKNSLPTCKVNNLFWDKNHRLWVGSQNGLSLYSPNAHRFKTYSSTSRNHILTDNAVRTIAETKSGQIVVGETGGSVDIFDATTKQWSTGLFSRKLHKKSTSSNAIVIHSSDDIWIGLTNIGILRLNGSFEIKSVYTNANRKIRDLEQYKIPLNIGDVYTLFEDEDETIWAGNYNLGFGTAATLFHLFPRTGKVIQFTPSTVEEQIGSSILSMCSKNSNELWLGTNKGLFVFNKQTKLFRREPAVPGYTIWVLAKNNDGTIWCGTWGNGTGSGIYIFNPVTNTIDTINKNHGLLNTYIQGIVFDDYGNAWISTNNGLYRYTIATKKVVSFNAADGLPSNEFNPKSYLKASNGELWFGGPNGVVTFSPSKIILDTTEPQIVVSSFKVFDSTYYHALFDGSKVELHQDQNYFTAEFAALDYTNPTRNEYAFYLEGAEKSWNYCGRRHYLSYVNLKPGTYRLHIKGTNSDGGWNTKGISITITILPSFWNRTWVRYGSFFIAFGLAVFYFIHLQKRKRNMQRSLHEARVAERRSIASDIHDGPLQDLYGLRFILDDISSGTLDSIEKANDISYKVRLELSRISRDLQSLQFENGINQVLQTLVSSFQRQFQNITWEYICPETPKQLPQHYMEAIYYVTRTALSNVIKHSQATNVRVNLSFGRKEIQIVVKDNGVGMDTGRIILSSSNDTVGHGFTMCRAYAKSCNGDFSVSSAPDSGMTVTLTLSQKGRVTQFIKKVLRIN